MIKLIETGKDDPGFVSLLETMVMNLLKESAAEEVYVFQLNKWKIKQAKGKNLEAVEKLMESS